jgi:hypothetical protein
MGLIFCGIAFAITLVLTVRKQIWGLYCVIGIGYLYGIVRANFLDSFTHFVFDASVIGFYIGSVRQFITPIHRGDSTNLQRWTAALVIWPILVACLPIQHFLIQIVGLRGNAFLVPFLIIGTWISRNDARKLGIYFALLNMAVFAVAIGEFLLGVPTFYPENSVTDMIYRSRDVGSDESFRIPGTFINAHAYAGNMVITLPWIIGSLLQANTSQGRMVLFSGAATAVLGVLLASTRLWFVQLFWVLILINFSGILRGGLALSWVIILGGIGYFVASEERAQRFLTLLDVEMVANRVEGSVNLGFLELARDYPMGNGMGGGGTSIPFFLREYLDAPIGLENEYSRIMLEQGLPGLLLWILFAAWVLTRGIAKTDPLRQSRRIMWWLTMIGFLLALLGTGMLTSIPQSALFMLNIGFLVTGPRELPVQEK